MLRRDKKEVPYPITKFNVHAVRRAAELGAAGIQPLSWGNYLKALEEIGFDGFLTIEREVGDNPDQDIAEAIRFLESKMA